MAGNNLAAFRWQSAGAGKTSDLSWLQTKAAQSPRITLTLLEALTSPEQRKLSDSLAEGSLDLAQGKN